MMKFHSLLYELDEQLDMDNVAALKFLCLDHIPQKKQEAIVEGMDLFQRLEDRGLLEEDDCFILAELLYRIKRIDLLRKLGTTKEQVQNDLRRPGKAQISLYRQLLYDLSEDITKEDLRSLKFFLSDKLPKCKLEKDTTMLHLLIEMEKTGLLGEGMFENLKMICRKIRPGLVEKIEDFEQIIRETPQRESCMEAAAVSISNLANCMEESTMSFAISNETLVSGMMEAVSMTSLSNRSEETTMSFAISSDEECSSPTACVSIDTVTQSGQHEATHLCMNQDSSVYEMKHKPRGYCLIFNNYNFEQARGNPELMNVKDRRGTEVDAAALQEVFTWLQFEVHQFNDLSAQEMQHVLSEFQKKDHTDRDCFICCILSHGGKGTVRATDGKMVNINTITSYFTGLKCRSLRGKPKVFFIQACQGENFQRAIAIEEDSNSPDALPVNPGNNSVESIPDEADFLLGMATMEHFVSYRIPTEGTWYIQSLCKNLKESCPRGEDILTILTNVNNEVSKKDDTRRNAKQMPQPKFTLRKKLIFPVH